MTLTELTRRVESLERKIQELDLLVQANPRPSRRPWRENAGRFKNDPIFDEIVALGAKWRRSQRPRRKKVKRDRS
jgi:hypothetical protein